MALLTVAEHSSRVATDKSPDEAAVGVLLGSFNNDGADIALAVELSDVTDVDLSRTRLEQFTEVFPEFVVVGWYVTAQFLDVGEIRSDFQHLAAKRSALGRSLEPGQLPPPSSRESFSASATACGRRLGNFHTHFAAIVSDCERPVGLVYFAGSGAGRAAAEAVGSPLHPPGRLPLAAFDMALSCTALLDGAPLQRLSPLGEVSVVADDTQQAAVTSAVGDAGPSLVAGHLGKVGDAAGVLVDDVLAVSLRVAAPSGQRADRAAMRGAAQELLWALERNSESRAAAKLSVPDDSDAVAAVVAQLAEARGQQLAEARWPQLAEARRQQRP